MNEKKLVLITLITWVLYACGGGGVSSSNLSNLISNNSSITVATVTTSN
jgi:hypothetical protein